MKKNLFLLLMVIVAYPSKGQSILFEDSFENHPTFNIFDIGQWTMHDGDSSLQFSVFNPCPGFPIVEECFPYSNSNKAFQVFNPLETNPPIATTETDNYTARTGNKHMVCFGKTEFFETNNDWIISPPISLNNNKNELNFWYKSCRVNNFPETQFRVIIFESLPNFSTNVIGGETILVPEDLQWREYKLSLDGFSGQTIYIGIECIYGGYFNAFAIDDFQIKATSILNSDDFFNEHVKMYPNPVKDQLNLSCPIGLNEIQIFDTNGRIINSIQLEGVKNYNLELALLTNGLYFIQIQTYDGIGVAKFIKN